MQKMIADKAFTYKGVQLCVGHGFDAEDEHVTLFSTIGFAHVPDGRASGQRYETRVMEAGQARTRKQRGASA